MDHPHKKSFRATNFTRQLTRHCTRKCLQPRRGKHQHRMESRGRYNYYRTYERHNRSLTEDISDVGTRWSAPEHSYCPHCVHCDVNFNSGAHRNPHNVLLAWTNIASFEKRALASCSSKRRASPFSLHKLTVRVINQPDTTRRGLFVAATQHSAKDTRCPRGSLCLQYLRLECSKKTFLYLARL